jgi:hypothetical protein
MGRLAAVVEGPEDQAWEILAEAPMSLEKQLPL